MSNQEKFLKDFDSTIEDYIDQEKKFRIRIKAALYIRAISLILIPVATFWDFLNGGAVILLTAVIGFAEFYTNFNRFEEKLHIINEAITLMNMEYYYFYYGIKHYRNMKLDEQFSLFVEKSTEIIEKTELKINNKYNLKAIDKLNYESKEQ